MLFAINLKYLPVATVCAIGLAATGQPGQAMPPVEASLDRPDEIAVDALAVPPGQPIALDHFATPASTASDLTHDLNGASGELAAAPSTLPQDPAFRQQLAQQADRAANGRRSSGQFSYIGIGGAIGLSGDDDSSALGNGGFALLGKTGFSENFALHNASILGDKGTSVTALTANFPIRDQKTGAVSVVPFVGAGIAISDLFGDETEVGLALTGGVDVPLSYRWTATGRVAAGFLDDNTDVSLLLGVGYTFTGFFK